MESINNEIELLEAVKLMIDKANDEDAIRPGSMDRLSDTVDGILSQLK